MEESIASSARLAPTVERVEALQNAVIQRPGEPAQRRVACRPLLRRSHAEIRARADRRNRPQVFVDGLELTIRHLAVNRPRHHLQDRRGVRRIPEVGAVVHDLLELLERPTRREAVGAA